MIVRQFKTFSWLLRRACRVEVPEIISCEHSCFRDLTFFSADSEKMKNISADQLCFIAEQRCFKEKQLWISAVQRCFSLLWKIGFFPIKLKRVNFPQYSVKWQQKLEFSEILFKFDPTKREKLLSKNCTKSVFLHKLWEKTQTLE